MKREVGGLVWGVNGKEVKGEWPDKTPLTEVLRQHLGLCAVKVGCDNGSCGSCTILVDGKPMLACRLSWDDVAGSEVLTPEGISREKRKEYAGTFASCGAACGFCVPGLLMRLHGQLLQNNNPPRASLQALLSHHYCRCSGYHAWLEALQKMVRPSQAPTHISLIHRSQRTNIPRFGEEPRGQQRLERLLAGEPVFVDDVQIPGSREGALSLVPISWGTLQYVDVAHIERMPGVTSVLTSVELSELRDGVFARTLDTDTIPSMPRLKAVPLQMLITEDLHPTTPEPVEKDERLSSDDELESALQFPGKEETSALISEALALWEDDEEVTVRVPPAAKAPLEEFEGEDVVERGPAWLKKRGEAVACCGDVVALVTGKSRGEARRAAELVRSVIEPIDPHFDAEYSHQRDPSLRVVEQKLSRGDVDQAFRDAFAIVSGTWNTSPVDAGGLEPPSCVAEPLEGERMRIVTAGSSPLAVQAHVAQTLGWQRDRIDVVMMASAGSSARKQPLIEGFAALMALREGKPVKLTLPRKTAARISPKRHAMRIHASLACDERGNFTGLRMHIFADTGGYATHASEVLQQALVHACGPYRITAYQLEAVAVCSNNPNAGDPPYEGLSQVAFALESAVDMLSERVTIDSWALRYRNALKPGERLPNGQFVAEDCDMAAALEAIRDVYYKYADHAGIACAFKGSGLWHSPSKAREYRVQIRVIEKGSYQLILPYPDIGQGLHDLLLYEAATTSECDADTFAIDVSSRGCESLEPLMAEANEGALVAAVREAALFLRRALRDDGVTPGQVFVGSRVFAVTEDEPAVHPDLPRYLSFSYAAQVIVLERGQGRIRRVVTACDVGRPLYYAGLALQMESAIHAGLGFALSEGLRYTEGIPNAHQPDELDTIPPQYTPYFQLLLLVDPHESGAKESKGDGSVAMLATAPALANAILKHEGIRHFSLPMRRAETALAHHPPKPETH